jgi:uncharacterized protein (TIGR03437 family)
VVNAASYLPGVSPGGLATIFGQDLSTVTDVVIANIIPLPVELAGVSVAVNGVFAPMLSVAYNGSEDQISFQVPFATSTGPGAVQLEIFNNGISLVTIIADSFVEDPGIFMYNGNYAVAVRASDFTLISPDDPASPGEVLTLFTTGLGPVSIDVPDGAPGPFEPLAYTQDPFQVLVNNELCDVLFSGLAPGFVGLYQLNLVLPSDLPSGNLDLQITSQYASSNIATLPVF